MLGRTTVADGQNGKFLQMTGKGKSSHEVQGSPKDSLRNLFNREHDFFIGCRVLCRDDDDFLWSSPGIKSELMMWRVGTVEALSPTLKVKAHGFDCAMKWDHVMHGRGKDFDLSLIRLQ